MLVQALIGEAFAGRATLEVLVVHNADPALVEVVRGELMTPGFLRHTAAWDLQTQGTPTPADLEPYGAVLLWLEAPVPDPKALGDVLADRVTARNGGLVLAGVTCASGVSPTGRLGDLLPWAAGVPGSASHQFAEIAGPPDDLHGALGFVDAGTSPRCVGLLPTGSVPLQWSDGEPLAVQSGVGPRVAGVNLWPPDRSADPDGWTGDGDQILTRSLLWSIGVDWPPTGCREDVAAVDRNCNSIDRPDEALVDVLDPVCAMHLGDDGLPLPSFDDYVDPGLYGCELPTVDHDGDGLGDGEVTLYLEGLPWATWDLACDDCANHLDPFQYDLDCDGAGDLCDGCPFDPGATDDDDDLDQIPTGCDNCPSVPNPTQDDVDGDGLGDPCDDCPEAADPAQDDQDLDGIGDVCDPCPAVHSTAADRDGDGLGDVCDDCPDAADPDQSDVDLDQVGDLCDDCPLVTDDQNDADGDGLGDGCDPCPSWPEPTEDSDGDGVGDACDACPKIAHEWPQDWDFDLVPDQCDDCRYLANPGQRDRDHDGIGDACDLCPSVPDPGDGDSDGDGLGDVCDHLWLRGGGSCSTAGPPSWILVAAAMSGLVSGRRTRVRRTP